MGEVFGLTPGKATNENDTLTARSAEQLGAAAAALHDQQARSARKGKTKTGRKTKTTKGKKGTTKRKDNRTGRRAGDSLWEDPDETPRKSLVRLFDGSSGGSTPQTRSSEEEPNTFKVLWLKNCGLVYISNNGTVGLSGRHSGNNQSSGGGSECVVFRMEVGGAIS